MKKVAVILGIIVIMFIAVYFYNKPRDVGIDKKTVECIVKKSTLYISTGCTACATQERIFGDDFEILNVVDCVITPEKCTEITRVPTWIINNEKQVGIRSIAELKILTNCTNG